LRRLLLLLDLRLSRRLAGDRLLGVPLESVIVVGGVVVDLMFQHNLAQFARWRAVVLVVFITQTVCPQMWLRRPLVPVGFAILLFCTPVLRAQPTVLNRLHIITVRTVLVFLRITRKTQAFRGRNTALAADGIALATQHCPFVLVQILRGPLPRIRVVAGRATAACRREVSRNPQARVDDAATFVGKQFVE
jgi:hypothetical protein